MSQDPGAGMAERDNFGDQLFKLRYRCGRSKGATVQRAGPHRRQLLSVRGIKPRVQPEETVERIAAAPTWLPPETEALLAALA